MAEDFVEPVVLRSKSAGHFSIHDEAPFSTLKVRAHHFRWLPELTRAIGIPITNAHNVRSAKLTFHIPHAGVLHGLAGYFEAVLYGEIGLSIHPETKDHISPQMLSWFPLLFPFKVAPIYPFECRAQVHCLGSTLPP